MVAQLSTGDSFGEAGLLLKAPSPVSVKASSALVAPPEAPGVSMDEC